MANRISPLMTDDRSELTLSIPEPVLHFRSLDLPPVRVRCCSRPDSMITRELKVIKPVDVDPKRLQYVARRALDFSGATDFSCEMIEGVNFVALPSCGVVLSGRVVSEGFNNKVHRSILVLPNGRLVTVAERRPIKRAELVVESVKSSISRLRGLKHVNLERAPIAIYLREAGQITSIREWLPMTFEEYLRGDLFDSVEAVKIVFDVFRALAYLHENNRIHRDVSLGNVFLRQGRDRWEGVLGDLDALISQADLAEKWADCEMFALEKTHASLDEFVGDYGWNNALRDLGRRPRTPLEYRPYSVGPDTPIRVKIYEYLSRVKMKMLEIDGDLGTVGFTPLSLDDHRNYTPALDVYGASKILEHVLNHRYIAVGENKKILDLYVRMNTHDDLSGRTTAREFCEIFSSFK